MRCPSPDQRSVERNAVQARVRPEVGPPHSGWPARVAAADPRQTERASESSRSTRSCGETRRRTVDYDRVVWRAEADAYLPPMLASICFWIFSRLNEPGVALGG